MTANAERFTGRVDDYERYRTRYPARVTELLREHCRLRREDVVADVGAGTGMLAQVFLEHGNRVIAIEPNAEMRAACARQLSGYEGLRIVDAAAEATGLDAASVDLVAVGRAFHWFDRERALAEFERILKRGGWVVLATNRRAQDGSEQAREYEAILLEHGTDYAQVRGGYRSYEGLKPYGDAETFDVTIPGEQTLTLEEFLGQTQSLSVTPMPGDAKYKGMQKALREFFAKWSADGALRLETVCQLVGWRTRSSA
jgi:ubiquinone/menaquinone biosynthesis C-methylase UbiE